MNPVSIVLALMDSRLSLRALNSATLSSRYVRTRLVNLRNLERYAHTPHTYLVTHDTARCTREHAEERFGDARRLRAAILSNKYFRCDA